MGARAAGAASSGDVTGRLKWHATRSLRLAGDGWMLLGAAAIGLASRGRRPTVALAALLLPALPALVIWSQRRHVLLLVPVALVGLAVAAHGRRHALVAAAVAILAIMHDARWRVDLRITDPTTRVHRERPSLVIFSYLDARHAPTGTAATREGRLDGTAAR